MEPEVDWAALNLRAAEGFTPSAPIDVVDFFAGRWDQLIAIKDAVVTKGQHAILFGERGVGKTSLVSVVGALLRVHNVDVPLIVRENCGKDDSFGRLWKRALRQVVHSIQRKKIGFDETTATEFRKLSDLVGDEPAPDEIVTLLRNVGSRLVFVFDEFDQLPGSTVTKPFADTIKALSDYAVPSTVVLVGVGDSISALLESHQSVERALVQIAIPRMGSDELEEILTKVSQVIGTEFEEQARKSIVGFSQGLPHYVHLLGLYATRAALKRQSLKVETEDVDRGVAVAVSKVPQSTLAAYTSAVDSPHRDALFKHVLLAAALTPPNDGGTFAAGDVRPALLALGKELPISSFAPHLNKFASPDRGEILEKLGKVRWFRYRFRNPLMPPYIVMRGVADAMISALEITRLRSQKRRA